MTEATYKRAVTANLPDHPEFVLSFKLHPNFIPVAENDEIFTSLPYTLTLDENGEGTVDLPTPDDTGTFTWEWFVDLPLNASASFYLAYDESAASLGELIQNEQGIGHNPSFTVVNTVFGRSGDVIAQAGDYDADQVTFTPVGNLAADNVQDAIVELDTEKAATSHGHDYDPAGSAATVQANLDAHEADTDNPHEVTAAQTGAATSGHTHTGTYEPLGAVATHEADTTNIHGIADTSQLATLTNLGDHESDTTNVHGIVNTANLLDNDDIGVNVASQGHDHDSDYDPLGSAAAAQTAAQSYADTAISAHNDDTTLVHGIADTSALLDTSDIGVSVQAHSAKTAAIAALTWAADSIIELTGTATASVATLATHVWTFLDSANEAAARSAIGAAAAADLSNKQDKDTDATNLNLAMFASGQTVDADISKDIVTEMTGVSEGAEGQVWRHLAISAAEWADLPASDVVFTPAGNIAAVTVQAAIEELDSEKSATGHNHDSTYVNASGDTMTGTLNTVGIGNIGALSHTGTTAFPKASLTLSNGDNNNVALPANATYVRVTGPTAAYAITGIAGGADGRVIVLVNAVNQALTIKNSNASSLAANRISTLTGADITPGNASIVTLIYDDAGIWRVVSARGASGAF